MRAGAREFLSQPIAVQRLSDALGRAAARRPAVAKQGSKPGGGKVLVFLGGKGGSGVTTVACNFAVSLVQECAQSDAPDRSRSSPGRRGAESWNQSRSSQPSTRCRIYEPPRPELPFQTADQAQLRSVRFLRLPASFRRWRSAMKPWKSWSPLRAADTTLSSWMRARRFDLSGTTLVEHADTVYLVMQAGIPELRNSHRVISRVLQEAAAPILKSCSTALCLARAVWMRSISPRR